MCVCVCVCGCVGGGEGAQNFKVTISNTDYDKCKTGTECGIFQLFMITNEAGCKW
jgi:hypothetical protein